MSVNPMSPEAALRAIKARLDGVFDHPDLVAFGPLREELQADLAALTEAGLAGAAARAETPQFVVVMEGGVIQSVNSVDPDMRGVSLCVIDYDTEGADIDTIKRIRQEDGTFAEAYYTVGAIAACTIDYHNPHPIDAEIVAPAL